MEYDYSVTGAESTIKHLLEEAAGLVMRDSQRAIELADQAIQISVNVGLDGWTSRAYAARAQANQRLSNLDRALYEAQTALEIVERIHDRDGEAHALRIVGTVYADMGRYDVARDSFEQALKIAVEEKLANREHMICSNLGRIYNDQGFYERALKYHLRAYEINRQFGNKAWQANTLNNLAGIHFHLRSFQKALEYQQEVVEIGREINSIDLEVMALVNLGSVYNQLGELRKGLECQLEAVQKCEGADERRQSHAMENAAATYLMLGDADNARPLIDQAIRLAQNIPSPLEMANAYRTFGTYHVRKDNLAEAVSMYSQSIELSEAVGLQSLLADTHKDLAMAYERKDDYQKAVEHYKKYMTIRNTLIEDNDLRRLQMIQAEVSAQSEARVREAETVLAASRI